MRKVYYIEVDDCELERVETEVRKRIIEMMTKEITAHSNDLASSILNCKPITKKKWYQSKPEELSNGL